MDDAEIRALAEQLGVTSPIDEVVAWARGRTDDVLANGLDTDLAALLEGRSPVTGDTVPGVPTPIRRAVRQPRPLPNEGIDRLPLPPVPQRPDLAAHRPHDSADDLEMLDEDDLELVEELGDDGGGDGGDDGGDAPAEPGEDVAAAMSSPEWKRALADAQGE